MKHIIKSAAIIAGLLAPQLVSAQFATPHYTMFMYNKLIYNPAYAGSRDVTSINALYRSQWTGIDGAPRNFNVSLDGPVGNYMKPFRRVALGLSINNETAGVTTTTNAMVSYAYRIPLRKSVLSFGLQAGAAMYSAKYSDLNPMQSTDKALHNDVSNAILPNFGAGVYWRGDRFYAGFSVPNLLENYYDKDNKSISDKTGRQLRSYYASAGYVFVLSENFKLEPQALGRYAANGTYQLPMSADFNLSAIFYDRLMFGVTYRTDNSLSGIVHLQVTKNINVGYAYDYATSVLNGYTGGTHEVTLGFDFVRDNNKYVNPRFVKLF